MNTVTSTVNPIPISQRLATAREAYATALKAAAGGDLKARAKLRVLREEEEQLRHELAVESELAAERAQLNREASTREERARRRAGLQAVDSSFAEHLALATHLDRLMVELGDTLRKCIEVERRIVEDFRAHADDARLRQAFTEIGLNAGAIAGEMYGRCWEIRPLEQVLRQYGAGAPSRPPRGIEPTARDLQRRALDLIDQARASVADPTGLPPAA